MIVDRFRFMRRNHPRFGAQIAGRRHDRNTAGTVMYSVMAPTGSVATSAAVAVRLLCLAHVLGRNSTGHDSVVTAAVMLRFPATMLLLLVGQRDHVGWSRQSLVVSGGTGWNSRMVVMSVVVDPRSLGWYIRRWNARQVRQMGWWRWWVAHVLWWGGMSVHHAGWWLVCFFITHETRRRTALLLLAQFAIVEAVVQLTLVNSSDSADFFRK